MTSLTQATGTRDPRWRLLIWGVPVALLALPAVAMNFTNEVDWTFSDFVAMGIMLGLTAGAIDALTARSGGFAYKLGGALAAIGVFLLIWINLAVGMIGDEGDPANMMFAAVIATIVGGAFLSHLRARGMAVTMLAAAGVQAAAAVTALALRWGEGGPIWPMDVIGTSAIMATIWLASAALFRAGR